MIGDRELRDGRRARVFDAMVDVGLEVLVLGRRDDIAYATGAGSLWTAGTRPFGAACVLVATTRSTHLLSTWDEGVPPEIPFEHLYGVTWNPAVMGAALAAIPGFAGARRLGVDALSPGFAKAAGRLAPNAELVPADDVMRAVRATKLPAELDRIAAAVAVARAGADAAEAAIGAGSDDDAALGAALLAMGERGVTVPSTEPVVRTAGGVTTIDLGVLADGYEGGCSRTVATPGGGRSGGATGAAPARAPTDVHRMLVEACRPGATGADLAAAATGADTWRVRGSGMGFEAPVITARLGHGEVLADGNVLSVEVGIEGAHHRELVHVTDGGPHTF